MRSIPPEAEECAGSVAGAMFSRSMFEQSCCCNDTHFGSGEIVAERRGSGDGVSFHEDTVGSGDGVLFYGGSVRRVVALRLASEGSRRQSTPVRLS